MVINEGLLDRIRELKTVKDSIFSVIRSKGVSNVETYEDVINGISSLEYNSNYVIPSFPLEYEGWSVGINRLRFKYVVPYNLSYYPNALAKEIYIEDGVNIDTSITFPNNLVWGNLTKIRIPDHFTVFPNLRGSSLLNTIEGSQSEISVPTYGLSGCSSLVVFPFIVNSLASDSFSGCVSLQNINLKSTITSIPDNCFSGCSLIDMDLTNIISVGSNGLANTATSGEVVLKSGGSYGTYCFSSCNNITSVVCNITTIPNYAFPGNNNLETVTINMSNTTAGSNSFYNCKKLKTVIGFEKISIFQTGCFSDSGLEFIQIDNGKTYSGVCFSGVSPKHVIINRDLTDLAVMNFVKTDKLETLELNVDTDLTFSIGGPFLTDINWSRLKNFTSGGCIENSLFTSVILTSKTTSLRDGSFKNNTLLEEIDLTQTGITSYTGGGNIGNSVLKTIKFPSTLTTINSVGMDVESFVIPNSVTTLGSGFLGFSSNTRIKELNIPNSVTSFGTLWSGNSSVNYSLKKITMNRGNGWSTIFPTNVLNRLGGLEEIVLNVSVFDADFATRFFSNFVFAASIVSIKISSVVYEDWKSYLVSNKGIPANKIQILE